MSRYPYQEWAVWLRSAGFEGGLGVMIRSAIDAMYDWQRKAELAESRATRAEQLADALAEALRGLRLREGYCLPGCAYARGLVFGMGCGCARQVQRHNKPIDEALAQHAAARRGTSR